MADRAGVNSDGVKPGHGRLMQRIEGYWLFRSSVVRYVILALAAIGLVIAALTLLASVMVEDWSQRDIDLRARLVFRSIRDQVAIAMTAKCAFQGW